MSNLTKIEWTERTWNPIVGCSLASPGCTNCYAMRAAYRMSKNPKTPQYWGSAKLANGKPVFTGRLTLAENVLLDPLKRRTPTTYFVNSMGDLFHKDMPEEWIDWVFAVMVACPQHTFQVLTKRADRMREYLSWPHRWRAVYNAGIALDLWAARQKPAWPLKNVWFGVSVEDQKRAEERIPDLLAAPAAIRFISAEPLLGPIDLSNVCNGQYFANWLAGTKWHDSPGLSKLERGGPCIDQVICGGESGPNARPMHPDWARSLRDQCKAAGTAFFFKQWGVWSVEIDRDKEDPDWRANYSKADRPGWAILNLEGGTGFHGERVCLMRRTTKEKAGRLLDGQEWNQTPKRAAA